MSGFGKNISITRSAGGIVRGNVVFEQVQRKKEASQYAVFQKDKVTIEPHLKVTESVIYQPLSPCPWTLPPPPTPYGDVKQLWSRVRDYVYAHVDFESDVHYDIMTAWILSSWVPERWDTVPYLWFTGPSNSGKTRCLDVLAQLAFRPLLSPSISASSLYRALESYSPTFLLDEFEMYEAMKEVKGEVIGCLNAGYRRGQVVLRTDAIRNGSPVLRGFTVFGHKAISSIEELPTATKGRCIPIIMSRAMRRVKRLMDKKEAEEIRGMLLTYRFNYVFEEAPEGNPIDLPDGRLIELYVSLCVTAPQNVEAKILRYAREEYENILDAEKDTPDAKAYIAIIESLKRNPQLWLPQSDILRVMNEEQPEEYQYKATTFGKILKRLNVKSRKNESTKKRMAYMDKKVLLRRSQRYCSLDEREKIVELLKKLPDKPPQYPQYPLIPLTIYNTPNTPNDKELVNGGAS